MDLRTVMLILAIGSFAFGLLLLILRKDKDTPLGVPFWIPAKILQGTGSLLLFYRVNQFDALTVLANSALLLGCSYEAWAIRILSGRRISWQFRMTTSFGIVAACSMAILLPDPSRSGLIFLLQSAFYVMPAVFLFIRPERSFSMRTLLAFCYSIAGFVFFTSAAICFLFPASAMSIGRNTVFMVIPIVTFFIFFTSTTILLIHAKERSDMLVRQMRSDLQRSESRFQRIVETANEGILIFDKSYQIAFANDNIAAILGYSAEEMRGMPYVSLFPEDQREIYVLQEELRKKGQGSVYECRLLKKDGAANWFLVSAKPIFDESGEFDGSFAMLTDIDERKKMELLLEESNRRLTELSNRDSLTGIANRRCFDAVLQQEYKRLQRSNSKLSVILLDIDFFKEYNDCYGHLKGDECLRKIAKAIESCINKSVDLAARYGGEEFACILPDTDIDRALEIAETIRRAISELKIEHKRSSVSQYVTASLGVTMARYLPETSPENIISKADQMLYRAKVEGRNAVRYAECR